MTSNRLSPCPRLAALFAALIAAGACATVGSTAPGGPPPGEPSGAEPPAFLRLALESAKELYVLGEPVYVTVRFENDGAEPLPAAPNLDPEFGDLELTVASGERKPFFFVPLGILDSETPPKALPAGAEVATVFPIFYGGRGWTFAEPGQYTLTAAVPVRLDEQRRPVMVRSKPVTITVAASGAEAGRLLMAGPQGDEVGKFLSWNSGDHLRTGIGRMLDVMEKHRESPLVDYLALALGANWSRPFKDYSIPRLRPADCRTAAEYLGRIRGDSLPLVLEIERQLAQARCAAAGNDPEAKRRALEAARRLIGTGTEFQPFAAQVARLDAGAD